MEKLIAPVLLIDGDIFCYRAAAATDGRSYSMKYERDGQIITVYERYKKVIDTTMAQLEAQGCMIVKKPTIKYQPEPESHAIHLLKRNLASLETDMKDVMDTAGPMEIFLSEGENFRNTEVYADYKKNRDDLRRPANLSACKQYCMNKYKAKCRPGELEADDMIAMRATELAAQNIPFIIVSIDKDMLQIPGHHWNPVKGEHVIIDEVQGLRNLYKQMLTGDTVDGIPGLKGYGPKTVDKLIDGCSSEWHMYLTVLREYVKFYGKVHRYNDKVLKPEDAQLILHINARLLYLLRQEGIMWEVPEMPNAERERRCEEGKEETNSKLQTADGSPVYEQVVPRQEVPF